MQSRSGPLSLLREFSFILSGRFYNCGPLPQSMACETSSITAELLSSYEELGGINHLDGANLPSKCAIASLCSDLLQILFPGFFEAKAIHREEVEARTQQ